MILLIDYCSLFPAWQNP